MEAETHDVQCDFVREARTREYFLEHRHEAGGVRLFIRSPGAGRRNLCNVSLLRWPYTPEDLKEGLAELKNWRTPDHDVYEVAAQLFDERFRRSGEEILDLVLSLPSRRRLAATF